MPTNSLLDAQKQRKIQLPESESEDDDDKSPTAIRQYRFKMAGVVRTDWRDLFRL